MGIIQIILLALSLCADCFAVSLCSSVTLKKVRFSNVAIVALSFAVIQAALLFCGWAFGDLFVGFVSKFAHIIGFLLLLYVGGSMIIEGVKQTHEVRDLNGLKNVVIAGVATSIDALAVGISLSMDSATLSLALQETAAVFVVTALCVVAGILGGKAIGCKFGHWAEIVGGLVLVGIGIMVLLG